MTETARLYGGSMYELAAEEQLTQSVQEQMTQIRQLFAENPDYLHLLAEPSIPKEERLGLIEAAFGSGAERYLVNFLKLLCERGLLAEYAGCCDEYTRRYNADHNIAVANVTSAAPLSKEQREALAAKLARMTGKEIRLNCRTDSSMLAGLRVELEGKQLDGTVRGRLSGLSKKLNEIIV